METILEISRWGKLSLETSGDKLSGIASMRGEGGNVALDQPKMYIRFKC